MKHTLNSVLGKIYGILKTTDNYKQYNRSPEGAMEIDNCVTFYFDPVYIIYKNVLRPFSDFILF